MSVTQWAVGYVAALVVFLAVDLTWLGVVARGLYRREMGDLLAAQPRVGVAAAFYVLWVAGVLLFAVRAGVDAGSLPVALGYGAAFGFFTYATYDLTCLAVLRDYPVRIALVDMVWGTVLATVVSAAGTVAARAVG